LKRDASVVLCKRNRSGRTKINRAGVTFHVHVLNGEVRGAAPPPLLPSVQRPSAAALDRAYQALFDSLPLDRADRAALRARGLTDAAIEVNGYATLPLQGRAYLARRVIDVVGEDVARAVPGIVWKTNDAGRGWWSVGGSPGLLIPARDVLGRIVAVKVRRRELAAGQPRYLYLTSSARGGASAESALHVPLAARAMRDLGAERLVITEGELKADVATALSGWPVVSIPGVGAWRGAIALAVTSGARVVAVALDMDARTNPIVARVQRELVLALRARVERVELWRWDPRFKGLDDYLARPRGEATT
jgi:hypothetical protein